MFANPLGLLALLAVPAVVGLHLFRRRYRPRPVAGLFLWEEVGDTPAGGRVRQPLVKSPSFWCELLAVLLAAIAFSGPRAFTGELPHRVVVIDGSASMVAVDSSGASAWSRGREWLEEELRELPARARVTLLATGPRPLTLAGPAAWRDEALNALRDFEPGAAHHDQGPTFDLARGLAGGADAVFVTDSTEITPAGFARHAFGAPLDNVAIVAARRTAAESGERIDFAIANLGATDARRTLRAVAMESETSLLERAVEIPAGATLDLGLDVPTGVGAVLVELSADALAVDDSAVLVSAAPRTVRIHAAGTAAVLRATLLASRDDGRADRLARVAPAIEVTTSAAEADLVLDLDGTSGVRADDRRWVLRVVAPVERTAWVGPFLVERSHPLLVGVEMSGLAWVGDESADLGGSPIVSAGATTLVSERRVLDGREIVVNADLTAGTFVRSPDWPILLANLVQWRRDALPGPREVNLVVGQELWVGAPEPGTWQLVGPSGAATRAGGRDLVFDRLDRPGLHDLLQGERRVASIGVSFLDPTESDLRTLSSGSALGTSATSARIAAGQSRLEWLLALASLGAVALGSWFVARRGA